MGNQVSGEESEGSMQPTETRYAVSDADDKDEEGRSVGEGNDVHSEDVMDLQQQTQQNSISSPSWGFVPEGAFPNQTHKAVSNNSINKDVDPKASVPGRQPTSVGDPPSVLLKHKTRKFAVRPRTSPASTISPADIFDFIPEDRIEELNGQSGKRKGTGNCASDGAVAPLDRRTPVKSSQGAIQSADGQSAGSGGKKVVWRSRKRRKKQRSDLPISESSSSTDIPAARASQTDQIGTSGTDGQPTTDSRKRKIKFHGPGLRIPPSIRSYSDDHGSIASTEKGTTADVETLSSERERIVPDSFEFDADSETSTSRGTAPGIGGKKIFTSKIARKKAIVDREAQLATASVTKDKRCIEPAAGATPRKSNIRSQPVSISKAEQPSCGPLPRQIEKVTDDTSEVSGKHAMDSKSDAGEDIASRHNLQVEKVARRSRRSGGSVAEEESMINVPKELQPYNLPGKTDYAIVVGSRLRNRNKKKTPNGVFEDIPYLPFSHQRRCKAIQDVDGRVLANEKDGQRCSFCAVGVTDFCYTHSSPSPKSSDESIRVEERYAEDGSRCISLTSDKTRRCGKKTTGTKFCYAHATYKQYLQNATHVVKFCSQLGRIQCVGYAKKRCRFAAVENVVFCRDHILRPPNKCVFVNTDLCASTSNPLQAGDPVTEVKEDVTPSEFPVKEKLSPSDVPLTTQCAHTNDFGDRCCFESFEGGFCRMHSRSVGAEGNSRNGSPAQSEVATAPGLQIHQATAGDFRCVFVNAEVQCQNQVLPGSILCSSHQDLRQNNVSIFDVAKPNGPVVEQQVNKDGIDSEESSVSSSTDDSKSLQESDDEGETESSSASDSSDSDSDSDSSASSTLSQSTNGMYSHSDFIGLWRRAEAFIGQTTVEIEDSKRVRAANGRMEKSDTGDQLKAQYGRLLPNAMKRMMKILELGRNDVFLDIGHGIGNTCLHVSFCIGCEARGIEVVAGRHSIAEVFGSQLTMYNQESATNPPIGKIDLRLGQLEDPQFKGFLTEGVTRAYVNNFNGVFADRSTKTGQTYFLDDYVAGLFALMAPGSIMLTFHPLSLGLDIKSANELRKRHGMEEHDNASFFDVEKVRLGKAYNSVKWTKHSGNESNIYVYKYRRLHQPYGKDAVFLCSNPRCEYATNEVPLEASSRNEEGRYVMNHCPCRFSPKNLRRRSGGGNSPIGADID